MNYKVEYQDMSEGKIKTCFIEAKNIYEAEWIFYNEHVNCVWIKMSGGSINLSPTPLEEE